MGVGNRMKRKKNSKYFGTPFSQVGLIMILKSLNLRGFSNIALFHERDKGFYDSLVWSAVN